MALIKCPECGRKNVSDSAEMCPDCGFGINKYFKQKHMEEKKITKKTEEDASFYEKVRKLRIEDLENRLKEERKAKITVIIVMILCLIIGYLPIYFKQTDLDLITIIGFTISGCCIAGLVMSNGSIPAMKKDLELAKTDYEAYDKTLDDRNKLEILKLQHDQLTKPKCPICNSTYIEKISTTNKSVSIAAFGLASNKIGKQYKCKNCKHMW